ncbi:glycolate oxidase iron-sulfur subunit [alpha proteobacterium BAL199]|jgi:glycolate oxidase iron-sulfur subunit|nr:glycolate oxidase iron-sulfur subunit [alpha proteobacterium BAL199]
MQTNFTLAQLADPDVAVANQILRSCVHCGFCTATCPTYALLGDELDSPRGRIYLIKDMLENDRDASEQEVKHIDRCLSCLSCMTTCPSGVHYMHLVDHARAHIERTYTRPFLDRALRALLANLLPRPGLFRWALAGARLVRPLAPLAGELFGGRLRAMLELAPKTVPARSEMDRPGVFAAEGKRRARVALLAGCAQRVLDPAINDSTIRLLTRLGVEVVVPAAAGCCGSLTHHMGREHEALASVKNNVDAWAAELAEAGGEGLDAIVINASGCGTTVKDYGFMLREDAEYAEKAARIAALTKDVTEFLDGFGMPTPAAPSGLTVAYHSACSMQHGQKIKTVPQALLTAAGFTVKGVPEGHLCCGSAGTYNLLQPTIARRLRDRKVRNIESTGPDIIATGNIGCMTQIGGGTTIPVVHTVQLLDWATGGPRPEAVRPH